MRRSPSRRHALGLAAAALASPALIGARRAQAETPPPPATPPPPDCLAQLAAAANSGDMARFRSLLAAMPDQFDAFRAELVRLADAFDYDSIAAILLACQRSKP